MMTRDDLAFLLAAGGALILIGFVVGAIAVQLDRMMGAIPG